MPDLIANLVLICQQIKEKKTRAKEQKVKQKAALAGWLVGCEPHLALYELAQYLSRPPSPTSSSSSSLLSTTSSQPAPVSCN